MRRAWRTTYRLTDPRRGEGSSDVDIARGAHGVDGVRHTASVPCRVAAAGVMGDKGEQRGGGVEWPDLLQGEVCVRGRLNLLKAFPIEWSDWNVISKRICECENRQ